MKITKEIKIGLAILAVIIVVVAFFYNASLGGIVACIFAGLFGRSSVSGVGSTVKQVGDGLIDDKARVSELQAGEQRTQVGLDKQAESIGRATDAVADAESVLAEIKRSNPGK